VIDIFAGPGGLGEGFAALEQDGQSPFKIALSIEKDAHAHKTLELRAFYRQFGPEKVPGKYYDFLRESTDQKRQELFEAFPDKARRAQAEAWHAELGVDPVETVDRRIREALEPIEESAPWVLVGGPPCQAYSLIGRVRKGGISEDDPRVRLYYHYRDMVKEHKPPVFVMENVKGLLSAEVDGQLVFDQIVDDLQKCDYEIHSFVDPQDNPRSGGLCDGILDGRDFVIRMENYGIPQKRHRVILLGVRSDFREVRPGKLKRAAGPIAVNQVIRDLPRLRSGKSKGEDSTSIWHKTLTDFLTRDWYHLLKEKNLPVASCLERTISGLKKPAKGRGQPFFKHKQAKFHYPEESDWFLDPEIQGVCNHETRGHIAEDLARYLFAACYAMEEKRSPRIMEFPVELLPRHENVTGHKNGEETSVIFADRFRVQLEKEPATTITSHIQKDGHYYIHYDASQCRSLTVREAARIQTFPDNYFFCGPRTEQYGQVGNAVPPLLSLQLARIVHELVGQMSKK